MVPEARRFRTWGAMLRATLFGICPACGRGRMFRGLYALHDTCPVCAVRFERDSGSWLGASVMTYGAAIVVLLLLGLLLVPRYGLFPGLEWILVGAAVVSVLLSYRPLKGWWVWWMWAAGFVERDVGVECPPDG